MYTLSALAASLAVANGFSTGMAPVHSVRQPKAVRMEEAAAATPPPPVEYSESLPMLVKRPQLKGYIGDVGFDPVGFSEILPMVTRSYSLPLFPVV